MSITPSDVLHHWQSRLRCRLFREHDANCHHELTSGWVIEVWTDPAVTFATYTPAPETMTAKHAAPRKTLLARIKTWWIRLWR